MMAAMVDLPWMTGAAMRVRAGYSAPSREAKAQAAPAVQARGFFMTAGADSRHDATEARDVISPS